MSRIQACFERLRTARRKALIPYVTAGDPQPALTVPLLHEMVRAGADILELGVPFSDPMADGPVIQRASERALAHGVKLRDVLDMVREFRRTDTSTPLVMMGYLNPIEAMGYEAFAAAARGAGVDGVITVDLPPEEAQGFVPVMRKAGIDPIFLVAPTSTDQRLRKICAVAGGFLYYVSLKGVTGAAHLDVAAVRDRVAEIRRHTPIPIGVGFGIRDAAAAAAVARCADAVVIGSLLVGIIERTPPAAIGTEIGARLREMRAAIDAAPAG